MWATNAASVVGAIGAAEATEVVVWALVYPNADVVGSTEMIIKTIENSAPGSKWAVGTELNLVQRLANKFTDRETLCDGKKG
jgi:quinolinate synthase